MDQEPEREQEVRQNYKIFRPTPSPVTDFLQLGSASSSSIHPRSHHQLGASCVQTCLGGRSHSNHDSLPFSLWGFPLVLDVYSTYIQFLSQVPSVIPRAWPQRTEINTCSIEFLIGASALRSTQYPSWLFLLRSGSGKAIYQNTGNSQTWHPWLGRIGNRPKIML